MAKKGGNEEIDTLERYNKERSKALLLSAIFCLLGVIIVVALIVIGLKMMKFTIDNIDTSTANVSFENDQVAVEYQSTDYFYQIDVAQIKKADSVLINNLGEEGQSYIIRSKEKLDELLRYLEQYGVENASYDIDESFFKSSALVAVALEGEQDYALAEQSVLSVERDVHYDLHLAINANTQMPEGKNSRLTIIKVDRIVPQMIYLELK